MYKKLFGIALLSILVAGSLLAGANDSVLKIERTCGNKHMVIRMIEELPIYFAREMNYVESIRTKGEKNRYWINLHLLRASLRQTLILNLTVTCQNYMQMVILFFSDLVEVIH